MNAPKPSTTATAASNKISISVAGKDLTPHSARPGSNTPVSVLLTEERVTQALSYLAGSDEQLGELKADLARSKYLAELAEHFAFKSITVGSIPDKQAEVQMSKDVQARWEAHFKVVAAYEKVRARREREVLVIDLFRTIEASRRKGNI